MQIIKLSVKYKLLVLTYIISWLPINLYTQVSWIYYSDSPVLSMDTTSNMWGAYGQPSCIFHQDTFKMWYAVSEGVDQFDPIAKGRIHYAWSLDGIVWNKYNSNPVIDVGGAGQWDGQWLDTPEILWDGTEYKLYYYGDSTYDQGQSNTAIGLAISQDGINWTKQGKVLQRGALGDWDGKFIESPAAYYDTSSGLYALLYTGIDTVGFGKIGLTVSSDGYNWIKYPTNPVFSVGNFPAWNDIAVGVPALIETNGVFEMWFCGVSNQDQYDSARVGYAVSQNGVDWIEYPGNPVLYADLGKSASFWAIDVVWDNSANEYKLYYEDFMLYGNPSDPDTVNAIYRASAPRNVLFSDQCALNAGNDTIIFPGDTIQLSANGGIFYQWDPPTGLSNPSISDPLAYPDSTTTYTLLSVSDSCITLDTITISVDSLVYIRNEKNSEIFDIFPNPVNESFYVNYPIYVEKNAVLEILDISGRVLFVYGIME
ncbi:MAG: hypothetical protein ABIJ97_10065 [Bacteroidota bacterium]